MILVLLTPNALEPATRVVQQVSAEPHGVRLLQLVPEEWRAQLTHVLAYVNGSRVDDFECPVEDDAVVSLALSPSGGTELLLISLAVSLIGTGVAISIASRRQDVPVVENPDGSATYGFYGFANTYQAEGMPLPVVYGVMRTAPPVINQAVQPDVSLSLSSLERLTTVLAVSEGPIEGFGQYEGTVETAADQDALVGVINPSPGTGLQVNGIPAENLNASMNWRTGTLTQAAMSETVDLTATTSTFDIDLTPTNGTADIDEVTHPAGSYASAPIVENSLTEFARQTIPTLADSARVSIVFERGLYEQDGSGNFVNVSKTIRIQYVETDSGGTPTGNTVLLPATTVSASSRTTPAVLDIPFDFIAPADYVPPASQGFARLDSNGSDILQVTAGLGLLTVRRGILTTVNQRWSMAAWVRLSSSTPSDSCTTILSYSSGSVDRLGSIANEFRVDDTTVGSSDTGMALTAFTVATGSGSTDRDVRLRLEVWRGGGGSKVSSYSTVNLGPLATSWRDVWHHVAVTFEGAVQLGDLPTVTIYVDGDAKPMVAESYPTNQPTFYWWHEFPFQSPAALYVGSHEGRTGTAAQYRSRLDFCELGLQSGILSAGDISILGKSSLGTDPAGNKIVGVRQTFLNAPGVVLPCDDTVSASGTTFYENYAGDPANTTSPSNAAGDFTILDAVAVPQSSGSPVFSAQAGGTKTSYWRVDVFVSDPNTTTTSGSSQATIESLVAQRTEDFVYPHTALASVRILAADQVENQRPTITLLVKGRRVRTWDGTVGANGEPVFVERLSSNPAWIAADLLTSARYGLGSDFRDSDVDWPSFLDWSRYCDEGVPDAFGSVDAFGVEIIGDSVDPFYQLVRLYVGIQTTGGVAAEAIPESWQAVRFLNNPTPIGDPPLVEFRASISITAVEANGLSPDWITADDLVTGLNEASNQLNIYSVDYKRDGAGFHGYTDYAEVNVVWNRVNGVGDPVWPQGLVQGDEFFADDLGLTKLATTSGYEARARFDGVFDRENASAWEAVLAVFNAGRAMPMKAGARVYAVVDQPRPAVAVFGQGDIVPDTLTVSYTGKDQIPNSIESNILDSQANFEKRTILVDHPSIQTPTAFDTIRKTRMELTGVTRRSQALRDATFRLNQMHTQTKRVSFEVGPDSIHLLPGDRFRLSHDVPEYGVSGRLRGQSFVANFFPNSGSLYQSWDAQGGTCAASSFALFAETTDSKPAGFLQSQVPVVHMFAVPVGPDGASLARATGHDGSDYGTGFSPSMFAQHVATSNVLYPPSATLGPLDLIRDASTFTSAFSIFVKEPTLGAAKTLYVNFYRLVDGSGTNINHTNLAIFDWTSGALGVTSSDASISSAVESIGGGWYRIKCVYTAASDTGASDDDYLQVRFYATGQGTGGVWKKVAEGGRGINFLKHADPLDVTRSDWTLANATTGANDITNTTVAPPFYTATDGSYGFVTKLEKDPSIAFGTTPPAIIQSTTLNPGGIISTWNGERVNVTFYAKLDAANQANNTAIYVDLRSGTGTDGDGMLNGDGVRAVINASSSPWSLGVLSVIASSGTVANQSHAVTPVYQNSVTNDPNWHRIDVSFDYTPSSGLFSVLSLGIFTDGGGAASGGREAVDVWGIRLHGRATAPSFIVNDKYHQGVLAWGAMYERNKSTVSDFGEGSRVKLDRDITLEAGNVYEVLLRSSFSPDAGLSGDASEVVAIDGSQVPTSGSSTLTAGTDVLISTPSKFTAREGDLFSFGKVGESAEDFTVSSISFEPDTMRRVITGLSYNETAYNDTGFGSQGDTTVNESPSTEDLNSNAANTGFGVGDGNVLGVRSLRFGAQLDPQSDHRGGVSQLLTVDWHWPAGQRRPQKVRVWYGDTWNVGDTGARPELTSLGEAPVSQGYAQFNLGELVDGQRYDVFLQPVGWRNTAIDPRNGLRATVTAGYAPRGSQLTAPVLTTTTRGFQQVYELERQNGRRAYDVVEGRLGGWVMATPIFLIDPDSLDETSSVTLVGQASTPTGRTGMTVRARKRLANGTYGAATAVVGTEQIADVTYTYSTATENDYSANGVVPVDFDVTASVMSWDAAATSLSNFYFPTGIDLGSAKRVLANCGVEAYQIRPETLADCEFTLGDDVGRRWSFEGPMDNRDNDNSTVLIEWRWTSAATFTTETFRVFRPGEVYARRIEFKVTFTRPTTSYNMRVERVLTQALELPAFEAGDIDGGTF